MATHREALLSESDTEYERKMNKATQKKVFKKIFKKYKYLMAQAGLSGPLLHLGHTIERLRGGGDTEIVYVY